MRLNIFRRLVDYWANIVSITGSLFLAFAGMMPSINQKFWFWIFYTDTGKVFSVGIVAAVIGETVKVISEPGKASLKREVEQLVQISNQNNENYGEIIRHELIILSEILGFGSRERISLYYDGGSTLLMLSRYSENRVFNEKGRGYHNKNQGIMGRAWEQNTHYFIDDLPACVKRNGRQDCYDYVKACELDWGMNRDEAFKLKMKSRTISAFTIRNSQQNGIAVIVFESMKEKAFEKQEIEDIMQNGKEEKRIAILLEKLKTYIPNPTQAYEGGF